MGKLFLLFNSYGVFEKTYLIRLRCNDKFN